MDTHNPDADLIRRLGGPSQVAELLHLDKKKGGAQRVQNWLARGIPPAMKVKYPAILMPELAQAPANTAQVATETLAGQGA